MRKTVIVLGIGLPVFFIAAGILGVIPWTIVGVMAPVSVGIAGLLLTYPSKKSEKPSPAKARTFREKPPKEWEMSIDEAPYIEEGEYVYYPIYLEKGDSLKGQILAGGPVDIFLVTRQSLTKFERKEEFSYEYGHEGVTRAAIKFNARKEGRRFFVVDNIGEESITADIRVYHSIQRP